MRALSKVKNSDFFGLTPFCRRISADFRPQPPRGSSFAIQTNSKNNIENKKQIDSRPAANRSSPRKPAGIPATGSADTPFRRTAPHPCANRAPRNFHSLRNVSASMISISPSSTGIRSERPSVTISPRRCPPWRIASESPSIFICIRSGSSPS